MSDHPHVLVLMCDQMQHQRMGFVDGVAHTPNLDRLASEGVHLPCAFTAQAQCVPSRAVIQTGRYAHECGVMVNYGFYDHQNRITPKYRTVGNVFRDAGYETVYVGKSHIGTPLTELGYDHAVIHDDNRIDDATARGRGIDHVPMLLRRDYVAAEEAVDWLRGYQPGDRPLFFTFSTNLPHPPFFLEPKYGDLFDPASLELPPSFHEETFDAKPAYQREHHDDGHHGIDDPEAVRKMTREYLTMIAMMDEHFGRIIAEFERLGIWDDTVVLFVADHGDMMGSHRMTVKGTLPYDELFRVPCIMKLPAGVSPKRRVVDDLVNTVQIPGTLAEAAGLDASDTFHHGSFYGSLFADAHPEAEEIFFEHYAAYWGIHPFYGVRTRDLKYIRYYGPQEMDTPEEMYDLSRDPHELTNVADDPAYAEAKRRLAARADVWWRETTGRDFEYYESDHFRANAHNAV